MSPVDLAQRDGGFAAAVITPLVERHVGDAAFYWTQHDRSVHSPLVDLAELRRFDRLLDAHLDGAQVAGETGWQLALAALARWHGPGEAFVCTVLALGAREPGVRLAATWAIVEQAPERMLRGVIGVFSRPTGSLRCTGGLLPSVQGSHRPLSLSLEKEARMTTRASGPTHLHRV